MLFTLILWVFIALFRSSFVKMGAQVSTLNTQVQKREREREKEREFTVNMYI